MAGLAGIAESGAERYAALRPHLDERQRRLLLGVEARQLGRGGIAALAAATGVHPDTIARGVREMEGNAEPSPRVRAVKDPDALETFLKAIETAPGLDALAALLPPPPPAGES